MLSHQYFSERSQFELVPKIIRTRSYTADPDLRESSWCPKFLTLRESENFFKQNLPKENEKYLLIVSTIEPRKNHLRLVAAWEVIKAHVDPNIKLVVVGTLGWDCEAIEKGFKSWMDRGELFMLSAVPVPDLRALYRHAAATVCPSLGEGFDFSGVESMACGGVTIASDIPVHREIYDDAAEYFNPYSTLSLVESLKKVLYEKNSAKLREVMLKKGQKTASKYHPDLILPKWERFFQDILRRK